MTTPAVEISLPQPPVRERRWLPVAAVVAVMTAVVAGGHLTADTLGQASGGSIAVTSTVEVTPLPGWELAERFADPPGVRLTRGAGSLDVIAIAFAGTDAELLAEYVRGVLEPDAEQLQVSEQIERVDLGSGLSGSRIGYVGLFGDVQASIEGEVTAVVSPSGTGVVFDGWAPAGQLRFSLDEIDEMIRTAEIA